MATPVVELERPVEVLRQRVIGAIVEYLRSVTLTEVLQDDGALRAKLREQLNEAASIHEAFSIVEVLKAIPSGDERFIELARQVRAAEMKQPLIALETQNKVAAYTAEHQIALLKMQLEEQQRNAEQQRVLQQQQNELDAAKFQNLASSLAITASSGQDPSKLADVFLKLMRPDLVIPPVDATVVPSLPSPSAAPASPEAHTPPPEEP